MEFLDLPNELILAFGDWADPPALSALASTSRRLHSLLNPLLYRRNAKEQHSAALIWAAANGRVDTANLCLLYGADINTALPLTEENQETNHPESGTPLHYAVRQGHDNFVRYLLANGADHQRWCTHLCECAAPRGILNTVNNETAVLTSHWSPLHLAICNGHNSTAKILIDWGVSCEPTLQLSWNSGPRAHQLQPSQINVMHEIAIHGNLDILNSLIFSKNRLETMINSVAFDGNTPLHFLAIRWPRGSALLFDRLLSLGPDLNVPNNDLLRPIDCFVNKGNLDAARRLFQLGSRPYQLIRCIISACMKSLPKHDLPSGFRRYWVQERNDLVLSLIHHALEIGQLTRDVGVNRRVSVAWIRIFQLASAHPPLLRELLRAGFRPDLLTGEFSMLLRVLEALTSMRMPDHMRRSLLESIRMLTRAGDRWDRRNPQHKTALDHLVKDSDSVAPELRTALFNSLLGSRPPEQTGAEQAHLNQLAKYALEHRKMEIYRHLVRHGAKDSPECRAPEQSNGSSATGRPGSVALQWFKPDLKVVTANRLGMAMGRSV